MNKNEFKISMLIVLVLFVTMLMVSGGTYAYFQWQGATEDKSNVIVSVTDDIRMTINPASVSMTGLRPTNKCDGDYSLSGISTVSIDNNTATYARPRLKLKVKITDIDGNNISNVVSAMDANDGNSSTNKPYMYYIKYAVVEENGDCTDPLATGRFNLTTETSAGSGWYDSPALTLSDENGFPDIFSSVSFSANPNAVTNHKYKIIAWIDSDYETLVIDDNISVDKLQKATIAVSWSENSTVEQVSSEIVRAAGEAYAVYSADDTSLRFYRSETPITAGSTYNGRTATAVYTGFEEDSYMTVDLVPWYSYRQNITSVVFEDKIVPVSTKYWFYDFKNWVNIDVTNLITSKVTDMSFMFYNVGYNAVSLELDLSNLNTSNVTDMSDMFGSVGYNATLFSLDLSGWDVSKVTSMFRMFGTAGNNATTFSISGLSGWNTSNVTNMYGMFTYAGYGATTWNIGDLSGWNTSSVIDMDYMFNCAGRKATTGNIGDISSWNVSNVASMGNMFYYFYYSNTNFLLDLSGWNVDNVHYWDDFTGLSNKITEPIWNKGNLYSYAVYSADDKSLRFYDINNTITEGEIFEELTVTKLYALYDNEWYNAGTVPWKNYRGTIKTVVFEDEIMPTATRYWFYEFYNCISFDLMNLNVSNVKNMSSMFYYAGKNVSTFSLDLSDWNMSNTTNMSNMFSLAGYSATTFSLDLSGWNTLDVTDMSGMFSGAGYSATTFSLNLSGWDTSKVTNMSGMFSQTGVNANYTLNLSNWNVCRVTNYLYFNSGVETKITEPNWGMSCPTT